MLSWFYLAYIFISSKHMSYLHVGDLKNHGTSTSLQGHNIKLRHYPLGIEEGLRDRSSHCILEDGMFLA